jgi:hypothetical protein
MNSVEKYVKELYDEENPYLLIIVEKNGLDKKSGIAHIYSKNEEKVLKYDNEDRFFEKINKICKRLELYKTVREYTRGFIIFAYDKNYATPRKQKRWYEWIKEKVKENMIDVPEIIIRVLVGI